MENTNHLYSFLSNQNRDPSHNMYWVKSENKVKPNHTNQHLINREREKYSIGCFTQ